MRQFGWTNPILVGSDHIIIAGHARLAAARKLGLAEDPVIVLDHPSEAGRCALVLAENKIATDAGWDDEMLRVELESLKAVDYDLELVGFSREELDAILIDPEQTNAGLSDDDTAPEAQETTVTIGGEVWVMGEHRPLCGDVGAI